MSGLSQSVLRIRAERNEAVELLTILLREAEENPTGLDMLRACNAARDLLARIKEKRAIRARREPEE